MKSQKQEYKRLKKMAKRNPVLYVRLASLELKMGKLNSAKIRLTEGLLEDPDNPTAHMMLAQTDVLMGKYESALQEFEETLRIDPLNSRARKAYIDLLEKMGRTDQIYNAHSRLYELSPLDEGIKKRQLELIDKSMSDLLGEEHQWNDEWHAGDFTEIGGLSRAVCEELGVLPVRPHLPKQFTPDVDESLVTQIVSRLPANAAEGEIEDPTELSEQESTDSTTENQTEPIPEDAIEPQSVNTPDSTQAVTDFPTEDISNAYVDEELEIVDETEDELTTEKEESASLEVKNEEIEEELAVEVLEEVIEEEVALTPMQHALAQGGQSTEDVTDFEYILNELKSDTLPFVEAPDLEGNITFAGSEEPTEETPENVSTESPPLKAEPDPPEETDADSSEPEPPAEPEAPESENSGQMDQSDLDALLAPFNSGSAKSQQSSSDTESEPPVVQEASTAKQPETQVSESSVPMDQGDLDALLASFKSGETESPVDTQSSTTTKSDVREPDKQKDVSTGQMGQSDLDSLLASFKAGSVNPSLSAENERTEAAETIESAENEETVIEEDSVVEDQAIADSGEDTTEQTLSTPETDPEENASSSPLNQDDLNALLESFKSGSTAGSNPPEPEEIVAEDAIKAKDVDVELKENESLAPAESVQEGVSSELATEVQSENAVDTTDQPESTNSQISSQMPEPKKPAPPKPKPFKPQYSDEPQVMKPPPQEEDLTDLIAQFTDKRRARPGSQQPVEIGKYAANPEEDSAEAIPSEEIKSSGNIVADTPHNIQPATSSE
ncbi:MAG TPA: tetratricopeptide repeat protein, partial [Bacteroidetes bacterium]|nr:tetratricopeptide repeat protein [Bacteroidota bacterium]HEX05489.1 tetratricopeptide repeat protein [Bacteroidota bacterium]